MHAIPVSPPNERSRPEEGSWAEPLPRAEPVRRWPLRVTGWVGSAAEWLFGLAALFVGLAVLAAVPIGQFLALGYLLEASGRVARSGRIRDGFIGVRTAARFGGAVVAGFLLWLPLYAVSIGAEAARIIDPHGRAARQWEGALSVLAVVYALHVTAALLRGGRVRHFVNPLNIPWLALRIVRGGAFAEARDRLWAVVVGLRVPYYFWLGLRGFLGALAWLLLPLVLLAQGHTNPGLGLLGGLLLAAVVLYLPFVQTRFALTNRLRAFRQLGAVRAAFRRVPLAFAVALWVHLLSAIPLYVLKIEVIPRELVFLEGLVFLLFMFPARLAVGWALARAARRDRPRHWVVRWPARFALLPVAAGYTLVVFASQHIGWHGIPSLFEQHAFLLPVPFVAWSR